MGNMASIIGGVVAIILGLMGLIGWWDALVIILKGAIPIFLLLGGTIALLAGISEMKASSKSKKE